MATFLKKKRAKFIEKLLREVLKFENRESGPSGVSLSKSEKEEVNFRLIYFLFSLFLFKYLFPFDSF